MRNKTLLLPVDSESIPLLRYHRNLNNNLEIAEAFSLKGWGIKEFNEIDYKGNLKQVELVDSNQPTKAENVIITRPFRYCSFRDHIYRYLDENKNNIKKIYSSWAEVNQDLKVFSERNLINFIPLEYDSFDPMISQNYLHRFKTPIILSASLAERSDKFSTQMDLYNYFSQKGYQVELVGTKPYGSLLGIMNFPRFMFENKYSNAEKIIKFNHFIKEIELRNDPDLIIIGVPGSADDFVNDISRYFDELLYMVSTAIPTDITIVNTLYTPDLDLVHISNLFRYKYGWIIDSISMNCFFIEAQLTKTLKKNEYIKIQPTQIKEKVIELNKTYNSAIFYSFDEVQELCRAIESKLVDFGQSSLV